jgi:hypothetical protein
MQVSRTLADAGFSDPVRTGVTKPPLPMRHPRRLTLLALALCIAPPLLQAQAPSVPDWALPGSATHHQVPPPKGFHRATLSSEAPIGIFEGQSDVGGAVVPGGGTYDGATGRYTINSAGYNIWYTRDEFRYLWRRMSGDASICAGVAFPNAGGYGDRKAVLVIRQDLDDDSKEAMTALHGAGLIHLAQRPEKGADIREVCRLEAHAGGAKRIGIEKRGDTITLFVSLDGEAMHAYGSPLVIHFDGPYYIGIGFCSHIPDKSDTAILSDVVLENSAGKVR